jgi:glycosyltransferase involved in cell wall biosynthesis
MNSPNAPRCSIIIRAYNEEDHIGRLLTGIVEQTLKDIEVIVVDSGSTDATVAIASRFPTKILSIAPHDFTFGRSLNLGCAAARGEFLVFASAHVYPLYPDWLDRLVEPFRDENIGLVYGKQRGDGNTRYSEHQQFKRMYPDESSIPQKHPLCNNANVAIQRSLWEQRKFDEALSGLEDLDWATWLLSQGHYLAYSAEAAVVHVHNESPRQVLNRYKREAIALARIKPEETFSFINFLSLYFSNIFSDLRSAFSDQRFLQVSWSILWFRWMQFLGTYLGFRHIGPVTDEVIRAFYYPQQDRSIGHGEQRELGPIDYVSATRHLKETDHDESNY